MKKILKNRIFLCVIVGICCIGIGVYGATVYPYQARDVAYNLSNGDAINVNDALNELYKNLGECSVTDKFRLGDYVSMTPTSTSYAINSTKTGWKASSAYKRDDTINPSELNLWRIIKINEDGTVEMVSENVSSTNVTFYGKTGYLNFVGVLNEIASQYENSNYTIGSRIMGYNGQTEYITDTSKFKTTAPWKSSTSDNSNETLGGGDIMYLEDTNLVQEVLGTVVATTPSGTVTSYWIGSRCYGYNSSTHYNWHGRYVNSTNNSITRQSIYHYNSESTGWHSSTPIYAVRPILTLKSGLTVTGSGTRVDPWVLQ